MDFLSPLQNQASAFSRMTEVKLDHLQKQATSGEHKDGAELKDLANQFESIFVNMLMKSMRETLPKDGLISSFSLDMYQSMFDQEVASEMSKSKGKGIGLAEVMYAQLSRMNQENPETEKTQDDSEASSTAPRKFYLKESRQ